MNEQCLKCLSTALAETSANCLVIYYEDMVSDPLEVGNRMYQFIGVSEVDRLDLENEQFEVARNRESWTDWDTPGAISGGVEKGRVGIAEQRLERGELDYICATTIQHPLLTERYSMPSPSWTAGARWCFARAVATRVKEHAFSLRTAIRQRLTG